MRGRSRKGNGLGVGEGGQNGHPRARGITLAGDRFYSYPTQPTDGHNVFFYKSSYRDHVQREGSEGRGNVEWSVVYLQEGRNAMSGVILGLGECPTCHQLEEIYWSAMGGMPRVIRHNTRSGEKCLGSHGLAVNPIDSSTGRRITKERGQS